MLVLGQTHMPVFPEGQVKLMPDCYSQNSSMLFSQNQVCKTCIWCFFGFSILPSSNAMVHRWRQIVGILVVLVIVCSWCSLVSGVGGWLVGYDRGKREASTAYLPESGVLVTRVERGSPAEQAGIARGDMIVAINGIVINDIVALRDELLRYGPGDNVLVTYRHNLGEQVTYVSLGRFPGGKNPYLGIYFTARAEAPADI